jgi:hypothetical protein
MVYSETKLKSSGDKAVFLFQTVLNRNASDITCMDFYYRFCLDTLYLD